MQHERSLSRGLFLTAGTLSLVLNACSLSTVEPDLQPKYTDEEKALTNLDLGLRYMELGQFETALEKLNRALDLDSSNSRIHDALGVLYERIGRKEDAEEHFLKALNLKPDDASAVNNYGRFLCDRGQYDQGMTYLKQAIAMPLNARKWFALSNAGICEYKQGHDEQAEQYLRTALEQQPNYAQALSGMVKITYKKGDYFKTRAFLDRYAGSARESAEMLWYAVQTERQLGNPKQAEEYRQQLLQKFPLSDEAKKLKNIY